MVKHLEKIVFEGSQVSAEVEVCEGKDIQRCNVLLYLAEVHSHKFFNPYSQSW